MGVGAGLYMYVVVVQKFTFAISSPDDRVLVLYRLQTLIDLQNWTSKFGNKDSGTLTVIK